MIRRLQQSDWACQLPQAYDIRFSAKQETVCKKVRHGANGTRRKTRQRFVAHNGTFLIDFNHVEMSKPGKDDQTSYEVELEIVGILQCSAYAPIIAETRREWRTWEPTLRTPVGALLLRSPLAVMLLSLLSLFVFSPL